ncbi:MAG: alpha-amylase, partial [Bacteroidales bacterium]|nr:alpha-amylase [Candidatus Sodaliphilus fimicaballi]
MKKLLSSIIALVVPVMLLAQGWPSQYGGVMLQGFYWDSYKDTQWAKFTTQADELAEFFDLVWIPQSGYCGGTSMGYNPKYLFDNYTSSFGSETALRTMISTFKAKGIGTIADVVINHRQESGKWVVFPKETYKGETMQLVSTDVVKNDDGGKTKTYCDQNGYTLSEFNDSGEGWDGMRDLDHNSANVQKICHAYLDKLMNDLGYAGVRYDMVKGYASKFTGLYNSSAQLQYSVGEYWDGNVNSVVNWINGTKVDNVIQSAAFDFPFRYT